MSDDEFNSQLNLNINATGNVYLTHTRIDGSYVLRMSISQTEVTERHIREAWELIVAEAGGIEDLRSND